MDRHRGNVWNSPMQITALEFDMTTSYPVIKFENPHEIGTLTLSGSYCLCTFNNVKITAMSYDINVGSLDIVQHADFTENKVSITTPDGTFCAAGTTVNSAETGTCPDDAAREAGFSKTKIDTSTTCVSDMYICSASSASCPASGTAASGGQGDFTIIQNDGPVQFVVDGDATTSSNTLSPLTDTFAVSSQSILQENRWAFANDSSDPRIYLYEVVSPGYERPWVHSGLEQYIQARPWLISILSSGILLPEYIE